MYISTLWILPRGVWVGALGIRGPLPACYFECRAALASLTAELGCRAFV